MELIETMCTSTLLFPIWTLWWCSPRSRQLREALRRFSRPFQGIFFNVEQLELPHTATALDNTSIIILEAYIVNI